MRHSQNTQESGRRKFKSFLEGPRQRFRADPQSRRNIADHYVLARRLLLHQQNRSLHNLAIDFTKPFSFRERLWVLGRTGRFDKHASGNFQGETSTAVALNEMDGDIDRALPAATGNTLAIDDIDDVALDPMVWELFLEFIDMGPVYAA
ncbi:MAG: hypothetical protein ACREVW_01645, partial [Burkholderiales bacterium]